ncbi:MAG: porin family protein [Gemmatimonadetes bacterium]|nr:porin family protein [Gemmatimonadota bacterium]
MRRFACVAAALALLACGAPRAHAQGTSPFSVEGRVGLAFPTGDFGDGLGMGYELGANAMFNLLPSLGIYAGYTFITFDLDDDVFGDTGDTTFNLQGLDAGVKLSVPTTAMGPGLTPYLRGGIVYYKGELSDTDFSSDSRLGFQVGAGLDYPLGRTVSITPEVNYVQIPEKNGSGDASFFKAGFGLRVHL